MFNVHVGCDYVGSNSVDCDKCGKWFANKRVLGVHIRCDHIRWYKFRCLTCEKAFSNERIVVKIVKIFPKSEKCSMYTLVVIMWEVTV